MFMLDEKAALGKSCQKKNDISVHDVCKASKMYVVK